MGNTLPGIKVQYHRACPCCGRPIAYVSTAGNGAWRHLVRAGRRLPGSTLCLAGLHPERGPNRQPYIATIIREVRLRRDAAARRHERRRLWLTPPLVRPMHIPGLPAPKLVTVPMDVYMDLQDDAMVLLRARHELQLEVERLQEQVAELKAKKVREAYR